LKEATAAGTYIHPGHDVKQATRGSVSSPLITMNLILKFEKNSFIKAELNAKRTTTTSNAPL
jgi:hypothetical protein